VHLKPFDYCAPDSLGEAMGLLAQPAGRPTPLAGGTDLLLQLKENQRQSGALMSLKNVPELHELNLSGQRWRIGAAVTVSRLGATALPQSNPCIADAIRQMATLQIRNRATIGGNLCTAAACADFPPVLLINDAVAHLASAGTTRDVPLGQFFTGLRQVDLRPDELLVGISLRSTNRGSAYFKFGVRNAANIAITGVACCLELDGETVAAMKLSSTAACPRATLIHPAAEAAIGQPATDATWRRVAELVREHLEPISDLRGSAKYRLHLAEVGTVKALNLAAERFREAARA